MIVVFASATVVVVPMVVREIVDMGRLLSDLAGDTDLAKRAAAALPADLWETIKEFATRSVLG